MPYIKDLIVRKAFDGLIETNRDILLPNGNINYFLYALCVRTVIPSYNNYKNFIGELRQCAGEIERRLLATYEDKKCIENGDVI